MTWRPEPTGYCERITAFRFKAGTYEKCPCCYHAFPEPMRPVRLAHGERVWCGYCQLILIGETAGSVLRPVWHYPGWPEGSDPRTDAPSANIVCNDQEVTPP